ncbi:hypothetical protein OEA41_000262 [Lepraria neglecta]|uniref:F-box domain-containing protein n=1 Tax=Lepraria neglecta TaxID=209136 RepID=A0AAD9ZFX4_9LECA|nr:hypothetical protein OEA41_000262 [Lepraria neglecta]
MSILERLPVEIFHEITSCLVFQDQKALSITSKQCHALVGPLKCPDELSWITHLCRLPPFNTNNDLLQHPKDVLDVLFKMYYRLIYDDFWDLDDRSRHPVTLERPFPQSTLAHWYCSLIHDFAVAALRNVETTMFKEAWMWKLTEWEVEWREIVYESQLDLRWLARRKPVARYQGSGKRQPRQNP